MEKQPHQEYRDELAKELKELRSKGAEGVEDSKLLLDVEGGTPEYEEAKRLHLIDIQEKIKENEERERREAGEKALREEIEKHNSGVEKMLEIIRELSFEYIKVPVSLNKRSGQGAVLLKIKDTDFAYLVSDDLEKCGSDYGIKAGGEKMFIVCGCRSCGNFSTEGFLNSIHKTAKENGVSHIVSRYASSLVEAEYFKGAPERYLPKEVVEELTEKDLLPTTDYSDNLIQRYKEEQEKRKAIEVEKEEKEKAELEKQKKIIEECYSLEEGVVKGDEETLSKIQEIVKNSNDVFRSLVRENIYDRIYSADIKNIEKLPSNINVLCISKHGDNRSEYHLKRDKENIDLVRESDGSITFEYPGGEYSNWDRAYKNKKYRIVGVRPGLNRNTLVVQATPIENKEYKNRKETETIELYTDIPILKFYSTPVEDKILSQIVESYNITDEEIKKISEKEIENREYKNFNW